MQPALKMKSFLFPLAVLTSSAMAQTASVCGADYIVESCLGSQKAALNICQATDYACHCNGWTNLIRYDADFHPGDVLFPPLTDTQLLHQLSQRSSPT